MTTSEDVIKRYVDAMSAADGDAVAALTAEDAVIELPVRRTRFTGHLGGERDDHAIAA